jgi:flavin reductase (DIM6/NTAB) family NADH-FMN oxidoreductase RutF
MSLDPNLFKKVMAQWSSGITIVTTAFDGHWQGITANSFSSVSLNPPLVAVSIDKKLYTHSFLERSGIFAVNILGADQVQWGKLFAGFFPEIEDRFAGIEFQTAITGSPILADVIGWVDCQVRHSYDAGDHTIFVGDVVAGDTPRDAVPLVYHNRTWGQFVNLPED